MTELERAARQLLYALGGKNPMLVRASAKWLEDVLDGREPSREERERLVEEGIEEGKQWVT